MKLFLIFLSNSTGGILGIIGAALASCLGMVIVWLFVKIWGIGKSVLGEIRKNVITTSACETPVNQNADRKDNARKACEVPVNHNRKENHIKWKDLYNHKGDSVTKWFYRVVFLIIVAIIFAGLIVVPLVLMQWFVYSSLNKPDMSGFIFYFKYIFVILMVVQIFEFADRPFSKITLFIIALSLIISCIFYHYRYEYVEEELKETYKMQDRDELYSMEAKALKTGECDFYVEVERGYDSEETNSRYWRNRSYVNGTRIDSSVVVHLKKDQPVTTVSQIQGKYNPYIAKRLVKTHKVSFIDLLENYSLRDCVGVRAESFTGNDSIFWCFYYDFKINTPHIDRRNGCYDIPKIDVLRHFFTFQPLYKPKYNESPLNKYIEMKPL